MGIWRWLRGFIQRPVFAVEVEGGSASVQGQVRRNFVDDCVDILRDAGVNGCVYGVRDGERVRLEFSPGIPDRLHQRLRNAWHFHH